MQDEERWLHSLGLAPGATRPQIDNAYRDLAKVWHPDRFQADPALGPKADAKLREINEAYQNLKRLPTPGTELSNVARPPRQSTPTDAPAETPKEQAARVRGSVQRVTATLVAAVVIGGGLLFLSQQRDSASAADVAVEAGRDNAAATGAGGSATPDPAARRAQPQPAGPGGAATVQPDQAAPMPLTNATLAVASQPTAATVYVDDRPLGQTPLTLSTIEPGVRRIRLELDGHPVWSSSVRVEPGSREKLLAVFEPRVRH